MIVHESIFEVNLLILTGHNSLVLSTHNNLRQTLRIVWSYHLTVQVNCNISKQATFSFLSLGSFVTQVNTDNRQRVCMITSVPTCH